MLVVLCALLLSSAGAQQRVRVGLGYLPDVQFAPFYAAEAAGLYQARGLEVEFQHGFVTELYPLLALGRLDFVVGDAEDVVVYRGQDPAGAPFKYVLAMYQNVPNVVFSLTEKNIRSVRDLRGKTIGIPGRFGTSYTSLQAMLRAAGLTEQDVRVLEIGFTQVEAVTSGRVDAAVGFVNNEPLVLSARGVSLNLIRAAPYNPAAGNGVITTDSTLANAGLVREFLAATIEGLSLTISSPQRAFDLSRKFVPNLADDRLRVLRASIPLYQSAYSRVTGLGASNPTGWTRLVSLLRETGRVKTTLPATDFYSNKFLPPR